MLLSDALSFADCAACVKYKKQAEKTGTLLPDEAVWVQNTETGQDLTSNSIIPLPTHKNLFLSWFKEPKKAYVSISKLRDLSNYLW